MGRAVGGRESLGLEDNRMQDRQGWPCAGSPGLVLVVGRARPLLSQALNGNCARSGQQT